MTVSSAAPRKVPITVPWPPNNAVPPMTTANHPHYEGHPQGISFKPLEERRASCEIV